MSDTDKANEEILYYNEACARCSYPADIHGIVIARGESNCPGFVRHDPPRAAYGSLPVTADHLEQRITARVEEILMEQSATIRSRQVRAIIRAVAELLAEERACTR